MRRIVAASGVKFVFLYLVGGDCLALFVTPIESSKYALFAL